MKLNSCRRFTVATTVIASIWLLTLMLLCGCSNKNIPNVVTQTHTTLQADSLIHLISQLVRQTDSQKEKETVFVFRDREITVNENGDTVKDKSSSITDRSHELEIKNKLLMCEIDSLKQIINHSDADTIICPVTYPTEVPTDKDLTWWQKIKLMSWPYLAAIGLGLIMWIWRKPIIRVAQSIMAGKINK